MTAQGFHVIQAAGIRSRDTGHLKIWREGLAEKGAGLDGKVSAGNDELIFQPSCISRDNALIFRKKEGNVPARSGGV